MMTYREILWLVEDYIGVDRVTSTVSPTEFITPSITVSATLMLMLNRIGKGIYNPVGIYRNSQRLKT